MFVGICDIGLKHGLVLLEEVDGTGILWCCIELLEIVRNYLCSKEYLECCVVLVFVLDKL